MSNSNKVNQFRGKSGLRNLEVKQEDTDQRLRQFENGLMALFQKVFTLEQSLTKFRAAIRVADWRSLSIQKLLDAKGVGITENEIVAKVMELQASAFDADSAQHDVESGLEATSGPAEVGNFVITTIKILKDGVEQSDLGVQRSKVQLGKSEISAEMDSALTGASVGETRSFKLTLSGLEHEAQATVLGIRKLKAKASEAISTEQQNQNV